MRGLKVKNGAVINIAVFEDKVPMGWVEDPGGVGIDWTDNGDGTFSPPVVPDPVLTLDELKARIEAEGNALVDVQTGGTTRKALLLVAEGVALLDAQAGRGGVRNPRQDTLLGVFTYVAAVHANMDTAFARIDDPDTTDPTAVTLEHPPLPGA